MCASAIWLQVWVLFFSGVQSLYNRFENEEVFVIYSILCNSLALSHYIVVFSFLFLCGQYTVSECIQDLKLIHGDVVYLYTLSQCKYSALLALIFIFIDIKLFLHSPLP